MTSESIIAQSDRYIAGGVVSMNRKATPHLVFVRAEGSHIFDANGRSYIDYHAAFAPHLQDSEPSADHYANLMTALQAMLLQAGGDAEDTLVLLPAWPCELDVRFKLWGARNTTVNVVYATGALVALDVQPPERAAAVRWANCVNATA